MSGQNHFDVIVVGVGSMGSAACFHLAGRGFRVLGLDPFESPHTHGSHHGFSRMIRESYSEHPDYVPLLGRAYQLWSELEALGGAQLLHLTGAVYFGRSDGGIIPGALAAARQHGLSFRFLAGGEPVQKEFPAFRMPGEFAAFHEARGGFLVPEAAIRMHRERARSRGADLRAGEAVLSWKTTTGGVEVTTTKGVHHAGHLVFTAGAWTGRLLEELGIRLQVTRQVLAWFQPQIDPQSFSLGKFPCWFIENESPFGHYGFPILPDHPGLKIAQHKPGDPIDPSEIHDPRYQPREDEIDNLRSVLQEYIPGSAGTLLETTVCLYTNSPDGHFIIGPLPGHDHVTIACGFSGHGFKFASVIGEILADLATDGTTAHPIDFLRPDRFQG